VFEAGRTFIVLLAEFGSLFFLVSLVVSLVVSSVSPDQLRRALAGQPARVLAGALLLGTVTPFCSCSTVPVVAGMRAAGVGVAATTAFLVVSPLVNPATVALLATWVSPAYALSFVAASLALALAVAGAVVASGVRPTAKAIAGFPAPNADTPPTWRRRIAAAAGGAWRDLRRLMPILMAAAAVGAALAGRVDAGFVGRTVETAGPWAVPIAVLLGIPVYASTAVLLPLGAALFASGVDLGVVTAFLIGATGLSVPEGLLLHRFLGGRYLAVLVTAFVFAAVAIGYLLQAWHPVAATGVV
jgi:uncharacterized membrane protein YraQ (UPF0718 family)